MRHQHDGHRHFKNPDSLNATLYITGCIVQRCRKISRSDWWRHELRRCRRCRPFTVVNIEMVSFRSGLARSTDNAVLSFAKPSRSMAVHCVCVHGGIDLLVISATVQVVNESLIVNLYANMDWVIRLKYSKWLAVIDTFSIFLNNQSSYHVKFDFKTWTMTRWSNSESLDLASPSYLPAAPTHHQQQLTRQHHFISLEMEYNK